MPRCCALQVLRAAISAVLALIVLSALHAATQAAERTRPGDTNYPQPVTVTIVPKRTTSIGKINDPVCPSGKRWVISVYEDRTLVETKYGECV